METLILFSSLSLFVEFFLLIYYYYFIALVCVQVFDTVMELVEYHKVEPLHLKSGGETTLKFECPH